MTSDNDEPLRVLEVPRSLSFRRQLGIRIFVPAKFVTEFILREVFRFWFHFQF